MTPKSPNETQNAMLWDLHRRATELDECAPSEAERIRANREGRAWVLPASMTVCPCESAPNREAAMVVVERSLMDGAPTVWCDPCIAQIVRALNQGGVRTVASCCGHREQDGVITLSDGRELVIRPDRTLAQEHTEGERT